MAEMAGLTTAPPVKEVEGLPKCTMRPKHDDSRTMLGAEFQGKKSVVVNERSVPALTDPQDAILKVTSTAICGSDLHMYVGAMPGMRKGDLLGHEFMGIVESVGPEVKNFKAGDRVVASFDLGCGSCMFCHKGLHTSCDATNPSKDQRTIYGGDNTAGIHGYSQMTGGWEGGQAEYARVVFADTNLLKIPDEGPDEKCEHIPDWPPAPPTDPFCHFFRACPRMLVALAKYLFLSDILCTAWHANELGDVGDGSVVAIWGAGPVGQLAAQCAFLRGASRVIIIDGIQYRLDRAKETAPGVETINYSEKPTLEQLRELVPSGPDVAIEAVGFHYASSALHKIEMALMLETDPSEIINELIYGVRKGGTISIVGVYSGYANHFNIGALMEKGLRLGAGQTPCQAYWDRLLKYVQEGKLKPDVVISHVMPLSEAGKGYQIFNDKHDQCLKVVLKPGQKPNTSGPSAAATGLEKLAVA